MIGIVNKVKHWLRNRCFYFGVKRAPKDGARQLLYTQVRVRKSIFSYIF